MEGFACEPYGPMMDGAGSRMQEIELERKRGKIAEALNQLGLSEKAKEWADEPSLEQVPEETGELAGRITIAKTVNHPEHYGGDTVYETIKVIEAWGLGFNLGNAVKYISRAGKKNDHLEDLKKARFYLEREISKEERVRENRVLPK